MTRRAARSAAVTVATALGLLAAGAGVASAHVTVSAPGATPGGSDVAISFRVPDESDSASTTAVTVQLPTDTPIASVLVRPLAGWTSTVTRAKLSTPIKTDDGEITDVVSRIDWKADSAATGVKPGQFGEFVILAGALPNAGTLTFKAIQTYSDATTTSWIEVAAPGSTAEPEHPAPVLTLGAAAPTAAASASGTSRRRRPPPRPPRPPPPPAVAPARRSAPSASCWALSE